MQDPGSRHNQYHISGITQELAGRKALFVEKRRSLQGDCIRIFVICCQMKQRSRGGIMNPELSEQPCQKIDQTHKTKASHCKRKPWPGCLSRAVV